MAENQLDALTRRQFLRSSGAAASVLLVGFNLSGCDSGPVSGKADNGGSLLANAFIRIASDNSVSILVNHSEKGNGAYTVLPMLIAEELDLDWSTISVEPAPTSPEYYHAWWGVYLTGGSSSTGSSWEPLRTAGAKTRAMMLEAASRYWGTDVVGFQTDNGHVVDPERGRKIAYGDLIATIQAHDIRPPEEVTLKDSAEFKIIGKDRKRIDAREKVTGTATFGIDVELPNLKTAMVARAPVFGGKVKSFDASETMKVDGVLKVKQVSSGVAVVADSFWAAKKGRDALQVDWDLGPNADLSSEAFFDQYKELITTDGLVAEDVGDVEAAFRQFGDEPDSKVLEAVYEVPYLAHATMEPMNAVADVHEDRCEVWSGTQFQSNDRLLIAEYLGLPEDSVVINRNLMGGSFGRRASTIADFTLEAVEAANGEPFPVKVVWSREDDMRGGFYRPLFVHKIKGVIDGNGVIRAWHQRAAGQSIMQHTIFEPVYMAEGIDVYSMDGCVEQPYSIANHRVESHNPDKVGPLPLWWRAVGQTHTGFAYESFLDELAHAAGRDPMELRLELTRDFPRMHKVLQTAAEVVDWGAPRGEGKGVGLAARTAFGSFLVEVAEVSVTDDRQFKVDKVTCVIDCGYAVNPLGVRAQVQSGIVYGLTAAAFGEIEIEQGRARQSNFHDYPVMRIQHMPEVVVHIVNSGAEPSGVGEPPTAPIAAAVTNALFDATGERVRRLPLAKQGWDLSS